MDAAKVAPKGFEHLELVAPGRAREHVDQRVRFPGGLLGAVASPAIARRIGIGRSIVVGAVLYPAPIALIAAATGPTWTRLGTLGAAEFLSAFHNRML